MLQLLTPKRLRVRVRVLYFVLCHTRYLCSVSTTTAVDALQIAVLSGSTRTEGPPRPILGPRVTSFIEQGLIDRGHSVSVIDAKALPVLMEKPHFAYAPSQVPETLKAIHSELMGADAFVCITPEYNHAPSPGLLNVLNHFGSSTFSFKPSAIVSYSAGQWGGTRAATGLRPILSELGCLPVSAMIHIPQAQTVLDDEGQLIKEDESDDSNALKKWKNYCGRCWSQLEWWGEATKNHKNKVDPFLESPTFRSNPTERNAP